jgi:hypothetical protein
VPDGGIEASWAAVDALDESRLCYLSEKQGTGTAGSCAAVGGRTERNLLLQDGTEAESNAVGGKCSKIDGKGGSSKRVKYNIRRTGL